MTGLIPQPHRPRLEAPQRRFGTYIRERRLAKHIGLRTCAEAIGLCRKFLRVDALREVDPAGG
jgi:hypothetical protein